MNKTDERLDSVAIIMDGNGRWAQRRSLARSAGHVAGAKVVFDVLDTFFHLDVHYVTLYAFSTENWKRPREEVDALMNLLDGYMDVVRAKLQGDARAVSLRFIGDISVLPKSLCDKCRRLEEESAGRPFVCQVALNYGGRDEIVHAVNAALADGVKTFDKDTVSRYLYTYPSPDPDLIIRTGGDFRISNFLLWQSAYSEYIILDTLWPDFGKEDILKCVEQFYTRNRRFGGLSSN